MDQKSANVTFVDTHAHLYFDKFDEDRDQVIQNALDAGVTRIINIGIDLKTSRLAIELAEKYEHVYAAAGFHPNSSHQVKPDHWEQLNQLFARPKVVSIGEIGLDYYWDDSPAKIQKQVLVRQLEKAVELDKPVIIHNREAWGDILSILASDFKNKLRGVFHCFSGLEDEAKIVLDLGFHISFTGVVTFKNSKALTVAADFVPLDRLLLETDCPFMAPVPYRGKRCEPAYVPLIANKIAEVRGINVADLAFQTNKNVEELFGIKSN
ncbi:hypothetical protein B6I21_06550 [candidate division KSB1 bacterium 4572_119]|nr:MAG: hypothetical protein B6I21_06550 [candidate division KSB1 bacterium 4572_119]